jgi:hypothetical protein
MYDVRAGPGSAFLQRSNGKHACHELAMIGSKPRPGVLQQAAKIIQK